MTFVHSFPFFPRCSRLVELVEPSGESDRRRAAMGKEPILGKMGGRQQHRGTCKKNDVRKGQSMMRRRETCRDSNAFPSAHCSLGERTPYVHPSPRKMLQPSSLWHTKTKLLQNLDCGSPAVPRQHHRAAWHNFSPGVGPTCAPAIPSEQGLQPHTNIIP